MAKTGKRRREAAGVRASARRLSRRRRALYLSIPYLVVILLLLPHVSTLEALVEAQHTQSNFTDRERVTIFEGDPLLFWRLRPNLSNVVWDFTPVSTNSQGLRHDGDVGRKRPGTLR